MGFFQIKKVTFLIIQATLEKKIVFQIESIFNHFLTK